MKRNNLIVTLAIWCCFFLYQSLLYPVQEQEQLSLTQKKQLNLIQQLRAHLNETKIIIIDLSNQTTRSSIDLQNLMISNKNLLMSWSNLQSNHNNLVSNLSQQLGSMNELMAVERRFVKLWRTVALIFITATFVLT